MRLYDTRSFSTKKEVDDKMQKAQDHDHDHDDDHDHASGEEDEDLEDMFVQGPAGMEWGGPTRGGRRPEVMPIFLIYL